MKTTNRGRLAKRLRKLRAETSSAKNQAEVYRYQASTAQTMLGLVKEDNKDKNARLAFINKITTGPWLKDV